MESRDAPVTGSSLTITYEGRFSLSTILGAEAAIHEKQGHVIDFTRHHHTDAKSSDISALYQQKCEEKKLRCFLY